MRRFCSKIAALTLTAGLSACTALPNAPDSDAGKFPTAQDTATPTPSLKIPVEYHTLDNGLKVVISADRSVPTSTVAVYYDIGFRSEPRGRTGFAHLFEHMMFQGSTNLGKLDFARLIQGNGGVFNGSTRFDFTNYVNVIPAHKLETLLWAEADRMRGLSITQDNLDNQREVVKNEVNVNVLNRPYGGFPWLDMPQYANTNWQNAHNFYGDLKDLDAATLDDVRQFFATYYAPNNAAVVVIGDLEPAQTLAWVRKYFGTIEARPLPDPIDVSEPRQSEQRRVSKIDPLAPRPGLAFAYHMPARNTPEYFAMGVIDQLLLQGQDSLLHQRLVKDKGITDNLSGGINLIGNMYNYSGPMLWTGMLLHSQDRDAETVLAAIDETILELQSRDITTQELERALTKIRSGIYGLAGSSSKFGLADLLAVFALYDDDPTRINRLETEFRRVTPRLVRQTALSYLRRGNRTVLELVPGATQTTSAVHAKP